VSELETNEHARLLSIAEVAMRLGLRETTIRAWLGRRRIGKVKLGRRTLIPAQEIERLISENFTPALVERAR
jgi:excisionase family DNA binding protein